jgi:hypothetical protein
MGQDQAVTDPEAEDTVRLDLAGLVDPDPTAYVERYRPPVPPPVRRWFDMRPGESIATHAARIAADPRFPELDRRYRPINGDDGRDETTPL